MFANEAKEIIVSLGDTKFTGKEAYVSKFEIRVNNNLEQVGFGFGSRLRDKIVPRCQEITCSLDFVVKDGTFIEELLGTKKEKMKIRNKKVQDCSIPELMFAVRERLKK